MARQHTMTPRRRAALRKAQLASARKRRKRNTVGGSVKRAVRQRASYAKASYQTRKGRKKKPKSKKKRAVAYTTVGLSGAAVAVYGASKTYNPHVSKMRPISHATVQRRRADKTTARFQRRYARHLRSGRVPPLAEYPGGGYRTPYGSHLPPKRYRRRRG